MENLYLPEKVKILKIEGLSPTVKLFRLAKTKGKFKKDEKGLIFTPGQFVLVGKIGWGESPFGPLSSPYENNYMEIAVRKAGDVTAKLHNLQKGDELTLRGPYGNGFPLDFIEGKDIVMVTGGCGIPPIAALVEYIIKNKNKFNNIYLLYGAKNPDEILMKDKIKEWEKSINVMLSIDKPASGWTGHIGLVGDLVPKIKIDPQNAIATMCGPGPMMNALEHILRPLGISDRRIFVSMERKMQCGIGKCQHCTTGDKYVCLDGPVFYYDQIDKNWD
jgi:NAD(P)H-flavin reductase